jgi:carboxylesterase type B
MGTISGESAGGASTAAHLFAPDSFGLFNRLIAKSGAIVNNWATKPRTVIRQISFQLARRLNCTSEQLLLLNSAGGDKAAGPNRAHVERIVECMSRLPAAVIQRESDAISESLMLPMNFAFVPIDEDSHFFKGNLFEKMRRKVVKRNSLTIVRQLFRSSRRT